MCHEPCISSTYYFKSLIARYNISYCAKFLYYMRTDKFGILG